MNGEPFYSVVDASIRHVKPLSKILRPASCATLKTFGQDPRKALHLAFMHSSHCKTVILDGQPAAMWGLQRVALSDHAFVWVAFGQNSIRFPLAIVRRAREELARLQEISGALYTTIERSDERALVFAETMGFRHRSFAESPPGLFAMEFKGKPSRQALKRPPFIIHGLGRSKSAWLSQFLSYGEWTCHHEQAMHMRSMEDVRDFFNRPCTGTSETAASFGWQIITSIRPDIKQVVVLRDVEDAIQSMQDHYDREGIAVDEKLLRTAFTRNERILRKIAAVPGVLALSFDELNTREGCKSIFEFCLPYEWDEEWWKEISAQKVETDLSSFVAAYQAERDSVDHFKALCKSELRRLVKTGALKNAVN